MKCFCLIILSSLFSVSGAKADSKENTPLKPFEFEISIGTTYGIDKYVGKKQIGPAFAFEGRYNFYNSPMDVGWELYAGSTARNYEDTDLSNRILSFSVLSDYNFRRGKNFSPFIGAGIGIASCQIVQGYYGTNALKTLFTPRLGFELFNHLRLTAYSRLCYKGYNNVGISIGYAFGGGKKKSY